MRADQKRLSDDFEALSRKALAANTQAFLEQAEERFKRAQQAGDAELAKREQAVKALVEPLSRTLGEVRAEMTSAEKARLAAHSTLAEQVNQMRTSSESLRTETSQLVTALRAPQVRGRWGELQLRRVVEAAGMVEHVDFEEQETVATDDGNLRPDLVVKLPGGKQVIVDAKVAFSGYLEAMEAKDDAVRTKRLQAHARHVRTHVESLGAKAYWDHFENTPEFVVMFLPAETFLNAALEQDPTILEHAFERNVVLATPATLVALLRTVAYTWRQEMLAAEAQQVFTVGRELHKRLGTMGRHLETLSKRLNSTVDAFNKLNSSLDSQVITQARRFSALQGLEPAMDVPPPLEILAVPAQKSDVHGPEITSGPRRRRGSADARARAERDLVLGSGSDDLLDLFESDGGDESDRDTKRATGT
ncbi:DNA recombination protein RmuC [Occultella glacieicola]|uniref:DNA recombination protein RmuC n=2 Tax=Occultella glacieicola TaxID=2518684 RepID=A0ABY2E7K3_9MICO|nr:DNA recombination protein RmuC [Occultella glacieicola]